MGEDVRQSAEKGATRADWPVGGVALAVAQFNDECPVGTRVRYWPGLREGDGQLSRTRSRAWLLGDHTPVVMIEGYPGGIALTHVVPHPVIPPARTEADDA